MIPNENKDLVIVRLFADGHESKVKFPLQRKATEQFYILYMFSKMYKDTKY